MENQWGIEMPVMMDPGTRSLAVSLSQLKGTRMNRATRLEQGAGDRLPRMIVEMMRHLGRARLRDPRASPVVDEDHEQEQFISRDAQIHIHAYMKKQGKEEDTAELHLLENAGSGVGRGVDRGHDVTPFPHPQLLHDRFQVLASQIERDH
jgi:hypothetical protein